jgi:hypothetical protein
MSVFSKKIIEESNATKVTAIVAIDHLIELSAFSAICALHGSGWRSGDLAGSQLPEQWLARRKTKKSYIRWQKVAQ